MVAPMGRRLVFLGVLLVAALGCRRGTPEAAPAKLAQTISLPGLAGRLDHMAFDRTRHRLLVAATDAGSVEAIDLATGKVVSRVPGLVEPRAVGVIAGATAEQDRVVVTHGGAQGALWVGQAETLAPVLSVDLGPDADNLRFHTPTSRLFVAHGHAISILEAVSWKVEGQIEFAGHPEAFQLESQGTRLFVNVPEAGHIAVADRATRAVVARWALQNVEANYPMALDESLRRLYVACRKPSRLMVVDTTNGNLLTNVDCAGDADDLSLDPLHRRLYLTGGEGFLDAFLQTPLEEAKRVAHLETRAGARTSLFAPQAKRVFVALPAAAGAEAEIRAYEFE